MAFLVCLVLIFCLTAFHRPVPGGKKVKAAAIRSTKLFYCKVNRFRILEIGICRGETMLPRHAIWI